MEFRDTIIRDLSGEFFAGCIYVGEDKNIIMTNGSHFKIVERNILVLYKKYICIRCIKKIANRLRFLVRFILGFSK